MFEPIPFLATLRKIHPDLEISTDLEKLEVYGHDEATSTESPPLALFFPRSTKEVSTILSLCTKHKTPLVPRGAGTGLSGAAWAPKGSVILSLQRMNQILELNEQDFVVVVEPGVITGEIRRAAEARGLFYPPITASVDSCSIGGNIATNAGGLCAVKYGVTREYVLGLELVLPTGEIINTGGRFVKNTTGFNLTQLIVGSEGTLGVVTKITLRLLPLPNERTTLLIPFDSLDDVSLAIEAILRERIVPPTLELLPKEAVNCVLRHHSELEYPFHDKAAALLMELDAREASSLENDLQRVEQVLTKSPAGEPIVASTPAQREDLWNVRKSIRDSIVASGEYIEADSVVPKRNVAALIRAAHDVSETTGLNVISYGHAGDGNLHTYFMRGHEREKRWKELSEKALRLFFEATIELGGTLSGEHGIGILKRGYLPMALSAAEIHLMRRLKHAFDPANILNPGKVIPE